MCLPVSHSLVCISGRLFRECVVCACVFVCVRVSVAVFMARQDVEVAVGCRVVCRPALQHHHPARQTQAHSQKTQAHTYNIQLVSWEGSKILISLYFAFKSQTKEQPSLLQHVISFSDKIKYNTEEYKV